MTDRRQFLKQSVAIAAPLVVNSSIFGATAPGDWINVAFIGTGNRGMGSLKRYLAQDLGNNSAVLCHLANAMIRLFPETGPGVVARWDAANETFTNSEAANRMLQREHRDPWS